MANILADLMITSLDDIQAYDLLTGAFMWMADELQNASIENSEEKTDITGKKGRKLTSLKQNKAATISGASGTIIGGLLEVQTGGDYETANATVQWTDFISIASDEAVTTWKAVGTAGAEIGDLYIKNADGTLGAKLEQAASADTGKFAYDPATKKLTFKASAYADGTEIMVVYQRKVSAGVLENNTENYSKKCRLYINATAEDLCGNQYHVQFYFPKADFDGNFTVEMGDNQTVHNFNAEALTGGCGLAAGKLWTYTVFGVTAEDVA